jgi:hypothetical protein
MRNFKVILRESYINTMTMASSVQPTLGYMKVGCTHNRIEMSYRSASEGPRDCDEARSFEKKHGNVSMLQVRVRCDWTLLATHWSLWEVT